MSNTTRDYVTQFATNTRSSSNNSGRAWDDECHFKARAVFRYLRCHIRRSVHHTRGRPSAVSQATHPVRSSTRRCRRGGETSGDRCATARPTTVRPAVGIIGLIIGAPVRPLAAASSHSDRRRRPARAASPTARSHDLDERTCSECKMSARAAGSRHPVRRAGRCGAVDN